jgi:glycosyltransferase involved in cell wall biosynthesis
MELVSIIIPVYNSEKTIKQTINSVLNQSYPQIEIIVINDGSTDNSGNEINSLNDSRIIYRYQENQGSPIAKNLGLSIANGKYVQFLDADDFLSTDKIENQVKLLDGKIDAVCVCRTKIFYNDLELENSNLKEIDNEFLFFSNNPLEFLLNLNGVYGKNGMVQPNAYLTPMKLIKKAGFWSPELNRSPDDDSEFFCRILVNSSELIYDKTSINYYRKSLNYLSSGKTISHAIGALKTVELKSQIILNQLDTKKVKKALAKNFAKVAYNYSPYYPEILTDVKKHLKVMLGYKKIPLVGGKYFKLLSFFIGFDNALKIKNRIIKKTIGYR